MPRSLPVTGLLQSFYVDRSISSRIRGLAFTQCITEGDITRNLLIAGLDAREAEIAKANETASRRQRTR